MEWFYFNNSGKPRAADSERLTTSDIVKLNGKSYLFNHLGNPVYGLKKVYTGSGEDDWTAFYFGDKNKSCVQKGKMKVTRTTAIRAISISWTMDGASTGLRITTYIIRKTSEVNGRSEVCMLPGRGQELCGQRFR